MKKIKKDTRSTLYVLITDFMLTNAYFKIVIVPFAILTYYAFMLHVNIKESVTILEDYMVKRISTVSLEKMICLHIAFLFFHYLYTFAFTTLITFFIINNFTVAFGKFTKQYMMVKYSDFHNIGSGKIRSLIERRSNAITALARMFMVNIYVSVSYAINNNLELYKKFGLQVMFLNVSMYVVFILLYFFTSPLIEKIRNRTNATYSTFSNRLFEMINNYDIVKTYNNDEYELKRLNNDLDKYQTASFNFDLLLSFCNFSQNILIVMINLIAIYIIVHGLGLNILANFKSFSEYNKYFNETLAKFKSIGHVIPCFIEHSAIFNYSCLEGCEMEELNDSKCLNFEKEIRFEHFGLKIDGVSLIKDSSFVIKKGEKVAIIGKNGCGKSCFLKVLLGFIDYEGDIYIDGQNLKTFSSQDQRSIMAYVPQNPHIIEGTVLENLKYGNSGVSNDEVVNLCKSYKTHNIFKHFENGYTTSVGESGKFLSGGQKQQISFMRGIIKDSDIYLVDEPTSNLDVSAEAEMIDLILSNMSTKTVFTILHNQKFLSKFDKVMCVRDQKVTIHNSFDECYCEI